MQARIMRAVFKLGLYAQRVRVALRRVRLDVHGVCAYVEVVLIALHYCTTLRRYRGMRSVANKAAAQAAAAPAGMRCVRRECGGLRPRERLLLSAVGRFGFAAVVAAECSLHRTPRAWSPFSMDSRCCAAHGGCMRAAAHAFVERCCPHP